MLSQQDLRQCLTEVTKEARELYVENTVQRHVGPPSPLKFYKKYVSRNTPCIFENCLHDWMALKNWNLHYLSEKIGNKTVSVAVTPTGYADAIARDRFIIPEERQMLMKEFLDVIANPNDGGVFYIQKQNSNLQEEFTELIGDVDCEIPWATEAFEARPDAANFWMGSSKAVTSLHKDPYENMYCVLKGEKTFTLYPPCDRPFLPYKNYPMGQYQYDHVERTWRIKQIEGSVPWIAVDPLNPDLTTYPQYANAKPLTCTVKSGEILYLPSLWFHHVQQADQTIAVNYWYDMEFDQKYSFYKLLDKTAALLHNTDIKFQSV